VAPYQAPTQKADSTIVTLELMHVKMMRIENLALEMNALVGELQGQVSELGQLLRESGGSRHIDTSTAGSKDVVTKSFLQ
jgi:hypothetical protein